jgi:hypothetical protein
MAAAAGVGMAEAVVMVATLPSAVNTLVPVTPAGGGGEHSSLAGREAHAVHHHHHNAAKLGVCTAQVNKSCGVRR